MDLPRRGMKRDSAPFRPEHVGHQAVLASELRPRYGTDRRLIHNGAGEHPNSPAPKFVAFELRYTNNARLCFLRFWQNQREHAILHFGPDLALVDFTRKTEASRVMANIVFGVH